MEGCTQRTLRIKEDAIPLGTELDDGSIKMVWDDDDYEEVEEFHEYTEQEVEFLEQEEFKRNAPEIQAATGDALIELGDGLASLAEQVEANTITNEEIANALIDLGDAIAMLAEGA